MSVPPKAPPRFVPTLTEVVRVQPASAARAEVDPSVQGVAIEEQLLHRVMQRVDVLLELRVQQAVGRVIQEQTRSLVPRLQEEIEAVVRASISEAVAQELVPPKAPGRPIA